MLQHEEASSTLCAHPSAKESLESVDPVNPSLKINVDLTPIS